MDDKITYGDLEEYHNLFTMVPSFVLKRMAKKNSNLVDKFRPSIQSRFDKLTDEQKNKLDIILNSSVDDLQDLMDEAYTKTKLKQYKILANPEYKEFIELNLDELRKMV
jgi:hypothetical protein